jgi:phenylacetate-CoA ligase
MSSFKGHPGLEFEPPETIRQVQEEALKKHLARCTRHSPFYRRLFKERGVNPAKIGLDTLAELPVTTKNDFARCNAEFLAVPREEIVDIVLSSGTTGKPNQVMYTEQDLKRLAYNEEISFASCGVTASDVVLLTCTMDRCFVAGLAYFLGIRALGAAAVRNGHGTLASHLEIIKSIRPTVLVGVPSFLRKLALFANEHGEDAGKAQVRRLVCIGEPVRGPGMAELKLGRDLRTLWNADVHSTYASSECITSFCECTAQQGGHLHPDLAVLELLDEHDRPVPPGVPGEVVLTPLGIEGMPLVRFKTGDTSFLIAERCRCGRTSPRLGPILGRKQQMMKVRGTSIYPEAVFAALDEIPNLGEYYLEIVSSADLSDELIIHLGKHEKLPAPEWIREQFQAKLRVTPVIAIDSEDEIRHYVYSPHSRKPLRVLDRRTSL